MVAVTEQQGDLTHRAPGTRLFSTVDNTTHLLVNADLETYGSEDNPMRFVRRPTVVMYCNADGVLENVAPDAVYAPGTTHEAALAQFGFELTP